MNRTKRLGGKLGIVLCGALFGALTGYTTYGQPSVSVGVSVPLPSVEIRAESDFYEPLTPLGEWVVVGSYGRCWRPARVEAGWQPYCNGNWQRTDAGWYWVSDEPWAWATYHYGRWNFTDQYGWYWVPQTQWAPAWVSWHEGGGYIGWAPLYPSDVRVISPRAYVFVEERHFMEPVRRSTVVVNSTTIINKTVINKGPATAAIEKASGRKVQTVAVQELRHKEEAAVVAKQRTPAATSEKTVAAHQLPQVRNQPPPRMSRQRPLRRITKRRARHASPFPPLWNPSLRPGLKVIIPRRLRNQPSRRPTNTLKNRKSLSSRRTRKSSSRPGKNRPQTNKTDRTRQTKITRTKAKNSCMEVGNRPLAGNK